MIDPMEKQESLHLKNRIEYQY